MDSSTALVPRPEVEASPGARVYPLFLLGKSVHLPNTQHVLNIFEKRYRKMINDILMSGSRSFAVTMMQEDGQLAETAAVFYLEDLKDVAEKTQNKVKYVCTHQVIRRVRLKRILNPKAAFDASDYLRVEVEEITDTDADTAGYDIEVEKLCSDIVEVVDLQSALKEEPRFRPSMASAFSPLNLALGAEGDSRLWALAALWQQIATQRVNVLVQKGNAEVEAKVIKYFTKNGTVSLESLKDQQLTMPPRLEQQVQSMIDQLKKDKNDKAASVTDPYQKLLQTEGQFARLRLMRRIVLEDLKMLRTRKFLQSLDPNGFRLSQQAKQDINATLSSGISSEEKLPLAPLGPDTDSTRSEADESTKGPPS